ncbi:hypothetical protein Deima_2983 [Deinococcus maricopensis DSM 21211]|uniref:Uncharacterized protein n=1 Tax=Deinococcus maricopensis (strain DSM 21211 / LMG 22137 / NRRL B-23946 / LB-34) TaxID=709986 RepID=E8U3I8_DEIML|nr:hypothetical protein Deima_2983 [Deinococcus maricopensis DSM 21211]
MRPSTSNALSALGTLTTRVPNPARRIAARNNNAARALCDGLVTSSTVLHPRARANAAARAASSCVVVTSASVSTRGPASPNISLNHARSTSPTRGHDAGPNANDGLLTVNTGANPARHNATPRNNRSRLLDPNTPGPQCTPAANTTIASACTGTSRNVNTATNRGTTGVNNTATHNTACTTNAPRNTARATPCAAHTVHSPITSASRSAVTCSPGTNASSTANDTPMTAHSTHAFHIIHKVQHIRCDAGSRRFSGWS